MAAPQYLPPLNSHCGIYCVFTQVLQVDCDKACSLCEQNSQTKLKRTFQSTTFPEPVRYLLGYSSLHLPLLLLTPPGTHF